MQLSQNGTPKIVTLTISESQIPHLRNILTHAKSVYGAKTPHEPKIVTERRRIIGQLLEKLS